MIQLESLVFPIMGILRLLTFVYFTMVDEE